MQALMSTTQASTTPSHSNKALNTEITTKAAESKASGGARIGSRAC